MDVCIRSRSCVTMALLLSGALALPTAHGQAIDRPVSPARGTTAEKAAVPTVADRIEAALAKADRGGYEEARTDLRLLCDRLAATAVEAELGALAKADAPHRVLKDLQEVEPAEMGEVFAAYRKRPAPFEILAYLLRCERDDRVPAYRTLEELSRTESVIVDRFPDLAAAVAAVHEKPLERARNSRTAKGPAARDVLKYFAGMRGGQQVSMSGTPAEVLVYVVDVAAGLEELEWARRQYAGRCPDLGVAYDQVTYDDDQFKRDAIPRLGVSKTYTLADIKRLGGVCVDQAHYATHVGKAFGVPTAYVRGRGVDVGHAWVGYLRMAGRRTAWDFSEGRYEDYENQRGECQCPVSNRWVPDGRVALVAESARGDVADRRAAAALVSAVERWSVKEPPGEQLEPVPGVRSLEKTRPTDAAGRLALLRMAVELCPFDAESWEAMTRLAGRGQMTVAQLDEWCGALLRLTRERSPDFAFDTLAAVVKSEKDPRRRAAMWDWAAREFRARPDLATVSRLEQASMLQTAGDLAAAWAVYDGVATTMINESPQAPEAVVAMLQMLDASGKRGGAAVPLLERIWKLAKRPGSMSTSMRAGSAYHRVGRMLVQEYERSGMAGKARQTRTLMGQKVEATPRGP